LAQVRLGNPGFGSTLGELYQLEQTRAIDQSYRFASGKALGLIGKRAAGYNVNLVCSLGMKHTEYFPDRAYPDLSGLPLLALDKYRLAILACQYIHTPIGSRTGVSGDGIPLLSIGLTDEFFEATPGEIANRRDACLPFEELAPFEGLKSGYDAGDEKEERNPYRQRRGETGEAGM
jgi:hypothetical protein